jgi:hypothetical protein
MVVSESSAARKNELMASPGSKHRWLAALACIAYALTSLLFQRLQGASQAAFGGYPDEPSHYVSGLLVHDYLVNGSLASPFSYAADYYTHTPFFALGYWPPLFYTAEALWMLVFGVSRPAVLVLIALIDAGSATLLFAHLRRECGNVAAFGAGFMFLLSPIVLWSSGLVMIDLLVTLLSFAAALSFARYMDSRRIGPIVGFSLLTAATLLTKSSGAFLAIVPPAAILVSGRFDIFKRFSFWFAPLFVAVLCAPWFLMTRGLLNRGFEGYQKPESLVTAAQLGIALWGNLLWLLPFALLGAWRLSRAPRPMPGFAAVCLVQPAAVVAMLMLAPVGIEARYLTPAVPPLLVLTMYGIRDVSRLVAISQRTHAMTGLVALLVASMLISTLHRLHPVVADPYRPIVNFVIERDYHSVLVPSNAEGPVIAEISEREPDRTARFLVRPGKLLASIDWNGIKYRPRYQTKEEIQALFDRIPVDALILRTSPPDGALKHEILLRDMVLAFPERWRLVGSFGGPSSQTSYAVYEPLKLRELSQKELANFLGDSLNLAQHR